MNTNNVLDAVRIECKYRDDNLYCLLSFDNDGNPYAVQLSVSGKVINQDQRTLSNIDALARMTTLAIRTFELDYVIVNLLQSSRGPNDLACIIAGVLLDHGKYVSKNSKYNGGRKCSAN